MRESMLRTHRWSALVLLGITTLTGGLIRAQAPGDRAGRADAPVLGVLRDAEGKPWAGATIRATWRPFHWSEAGGALREQVTTSSAAGRFRLRLPGIGTHRLHAYQVLDDGRILTTGATEVRAGDIVDLRAGPPAEPLIARVSGLDQPPAAYRARLVHVEENCRIEPLAEPRVDSGTGTVAWKLPPTTDAAVVELVTEAGERVLTATVGAVRNRDVLDVPPPRYRLVQTHPGAADVSWLERGVLRPATRTGDNGLGALREATFYSHSEGAVRRQLPWDHLLAQRAGHLSGALSALLSPPINMRQLRARRAADAAAALALANPERGVILLSDEAPFRTRLTCGGQPLANHQVAWRGRVTSRNPRYPEKDPTHDRVGAIFTQTDANGALELPVREADIANLSVAVDEHVASRLPPSWRPFVSGAITFNTTPTTEDSESGTGGRCIEILDAVRPVAVRPTARDATGNRLEAATLAQPLWTVVRTGISLAEMSMQPQRDGYLRWLLPIDSELKLRLRTVTQHRFAGVLRVLPNPGEREPIALSIQLSEPHVYRARPVLPPDVTPPDELRMKVTVRPMKEARDKPVPVKVEHADIELARSSTPAGIGPKSTSYAISKAMAPVELRVPPDLARWKLGATIEVDGKTYVSNDIWLEPGDAAGGPIDLVFEIPNPEETLRKLMRRR